MQLWLKLFLARGHYHQHRLLPARILVWQQRKCIYSTFYKVHVQPVSKSLGIDDQLFMRHKKIMDIQSQSKTNVLIQATSQQHRDMSPRRRTRGNLGKLFGINYISRSRTADAPLKFKHSSVTADALDLGRRSYCMKLTVPHRGHSSSRSSGWAPAESSRRSFLVGSS